MTGCLDDTTASDRDPGGERGRKKEEERERKEEKEVRERGEGINSLFM